MAYIHKKKIGEKTYYTLRISVRIGEKVIAKDIEVLGTDISNIKIDDLEKKHSKEIRKSYYTIKKFLEKNRYEEELKNQKLKKQELLTTNQLIKIESTKKHYQNKFLKLHELTQKDILEIFLIRFAVNTTAIEGNTITLKEAIKLFKEDQIPKNHTTREVYDLTNTKKVFYELLETKQEINKQLMINIHDKLLDNIDERKGFRNHDIHIFGQPFKPTPTQFVRRDLDLLLEWYKKNKKQLHPLVLATLFHHKFESIHPFSDGNGRTGRMMMNLIMMQNDYPPIVIERRNRKEYLDAMSEADKATKKDLKSNKQEYLKLIEFTTEQLVKSYWDIFLF
ncbi:MAG: Fic family protein [Nanoarchaeota archaeon]|nr:Fic family protein [Nanoarchaeota archaeon]MBU1854223.1 Fic family protein [Nanoarchaeota archaeon]